MKIVENGRILVDVSWINSIILHDIILGGDRVIGHPMWNCSNGVIEWW
jgi:hypothetical protein